MVGHDFGMHRAGVLLHLLLLLLACRAGGRRADRGRVIAIGVLCNRGVSEQQRNRARYYGCNVVSHFVWL